MGVVMKLSGLIELGSVASIGFDDAVKVNVVFGENNFDVYVKPVPSVADFEFIYSAKGEDDSYGARRVSRFIMLDEHERIPYESAKRLKTELLTALTTAINKVQGPDQYQKKN